MKAIILAAGYATRLYPLTLNTPKALLTIGGKSIIDYIVDEINTINEIDEIIVVSNHKFYNNFIEWEKSKFNSKPIKILDDLTTDESNRLGAIGDILFTIEKENIQDSLFVVAGDNLFTFKLLEYYHYYVAHHADCICVKEFNNIEALKQLGVAVLDELDKVIELQEKPQNPKSNTAVYASYFFMKDTLDLFRQYIKEGNKPDAPGFFIEWLYRRKDVFAYRFQGECYDVGTPEVYEEVQKLF